MINGLIKSDVVDYFFSCEGDEARVEKVRMKFYRETQIRWKCARTIDPYNALSIIRSLNDDCWFEFAENENEDHAKVWSYISYISCISCISLSRLGVAWSEFEPGSSSCRSGAFPMFFSFRNDYLIVQK